MHFATYFLLLIVKAARRWHLSQSYNPGKLEVRRNLNLPLHKTDSFGWWQVSCCRALAMEDAARKVGVSLRSTADGILEPLSNTLGLSLWPRKRQAVRPGCRGKGGSVGDEECYPFPLSLYVSRSYMILLSSLPLHSFFSKYFSITLCWAENQRWISLNSYAQGAHKLVMRTDTRTNHREMWSVLEWKGPQRTIGSRQMEELAPVRKGSTDQDIIDT